MPGGYSFGGAELDHLPVDPGLRYLEIALRLKRLEPGMVESHTGLRELAVRIEREPAPSPDGLRGEVEDLRSTLERDETSRDRRDWLLGQIAGIDAFLGHLEGERPGYRQLAERCYGVEPALVPESQFAAAHERLAEVLPGSGDVRLRHRRWAATQRVPRRRLLPALESMARELRRRTRELTELPVDEAVSFELVQGRHWAANADYLGASRTRVQINQDLPVSSSRLLELVSHEAYPGHHTEAACKDAELIGARGRVELAVYVYCSPQALIAEGIAMLGLEVLLGEEADRVAAAQLRPLGIAHDEVLAAAAREAAELLLPIRANIAMQLDAGQTREEVRAYALRWMLEDEDEVDRALSSLAARRWMPIESCYPEGLALCRRFVRGDAMRFSQLLREQRTTADLLAESG
jgi:hypothetical protein